MKVFTSLAFPVKAAEKCEIMTVTDKLPTLSEICLFNVAGNVIYRTS